MENNINCCQGMLGWRVVKTADVNIPKATLTELVHVKTGAKYIHLAADNKENVFVVAFKTLPQDSTGVAHILEHTALTGSEKYPIRDPFFSMLKRSLQTFLNAFTSEDWTAYPFASPNKKDFYNLMDLYLDAAFFPKLEKLNFLQEGWRYAFDEDKKLKYEGVVYNEMKGSMSSVDRVMWQEIVTGLYAEAPYHFNTGGDPSVIPSLTYDDFKAFHKLNYHPSNALFFTYGNLPLADNLKLINEKVIDKFEKSETVSIKKEKRWESEKRTVAYYPITKTEDSDKHQVALAWLASVGKDNLEVFSLELLEDILLANQASPLKKILLESGLGSDLCDNTGYESETYDTSFVLGLKDVKKENIEKVEELVMTSLIDLVEKGLDKSLVEAVINNNETRKKNESNQPYPLGLQVFLNIISPSMYGADVSETLAFDALLDEIKTRVKQGGYFEGIIKKYFLDNTHKLTLVLTPDIHMQSRLDREEREALEVHEKSLSEEERQDIIHNSEKLVTLQQKEEDTSCLPSLEIDDIAKNVEINKADKSSTKFVQRYTRNTNGLIHFVGAYDMSDIDTSLLASMPLFSYLLTKMNTEKSGFADLAKRIDNLTGGIRMQVSASKVFSQNNQYSRMAVLQSYALERNVEHMFDILEEVLCTSDFGDLARVKMLSDVYLSQFQSSIVGSGHSYAMMKSASVLSQSASTNESWQGISQLEYLNNSLKTKSSDTLNKNFAQLREILSEKDISSAAIIGQGEGLDNALARVEKGTQVEASLASNETNNQNLRQAYVTSTQVSFVAASLKVADIESSDAASLMVLNKFLARGFLHNEIREKRGAYGGFCRYDHLGGIWSFGSYRDPHVVSTLDAFAQARRYAMKGELTQTDVEELIISVSSDLDTPGTEQELAKRAYTRKLSALSDDMRQSFKSSLLDVKKEDIVRVAEKYLSDDWRNYSTVVISNKEKIDSVNERLESGGFEVREI